MAGFISFDPIEGENPTERHTRYVQEAVGAASMSWKTMPKGIFDEKHASKVAAALNARVQPLVADSILLNQIGWRIATVLGHAHAGDGEVDVNVQALVEELIAKAGLS